MAKSKLSLCKLLKEHQYIKKSATDLLRHNAVELQQILDDHIALKSSLVNQINELGIDYDLELAKPHTTIYLSELLLHIVNQQYEEHLKAVAFANEQLNLIRSFNKDVKNDFRFTERGNY